MHGYEKYENYFGDETPINKRVKNKDRPKPKKSKHKHEYRVIGEKSLEKELEEHKDSEENVMVGGDLNLRYDCKICGKEKPGPLIITKSDLIDFKQKVDNGEIEYQLPPPIEVEDFLPEVR